MSSTGFVFTETDAGTKRAAITALDRTQKALDQEFIICAKEYWERVFETTQRLCYEYVYSGPESKNYKRTGALYSSIRLVWDAGGGFGQFEVVAGSEGANITALIRVGGGTFINPHTGRIVDYAAAVHDGTRYMAARPFLADAISLNEGYLQQLMQRHTDKALSSFERV